MNPSTWPRMLHIGWIMVVLDQFVICSKKKSEREFLATNLFLIGVYQL